MSTDTLRDDLQHALGAAYALERELGGAGYVYYPGRREYEVAPGDQRFLMVRPVTADAPSDVILVKNWSAELERTMHRK